MQGVDDPIPQPNEDSASEGLGGSEGQESSSSSDEDSSADKKPNIMFVGKENYTVTEEGESITQIRKREPIDHIVDGMTRIQLPSAEEQESPFYHEDAGRIIALLPDLYKRYVDK